jgi:dihydroorotate dehydrogenase (NAD+) catalytic subunit
MVSTATQLDLSVDLGPLHLPNPITLASGTCGYGIELAEFLDLSQLGGIFTKGLSMQPRAGNAPERIAETEGGMINRIGLQNVGIEAFVSEKMPAIAPYQIPVLPNLAGSSIDEYVTMTERLEGVPGIAGLELNVSCPNVAHGGIEFGTDPHLLERLVAAVRARTRRPLVVKLTPIPSLVADLARAVEAAGGDVLSAINTLPAASVSAHFESGKLVARTVRGGLSGPAIKPLALRCVAEARRACGLPVIGLGGIRSLEDVLEFLAVGASAVQIGTMTFVEPGISVRLLHELQTWMGDRQIRRLRDILPEREAIEC